MRRTTRVVAVVAALFAGAVVAGAQTPRGARAPQTSPAPRTLTFCVGMDNLPMSDASGPSGFEVDLARALAERLGAAARFEWLDPHRDFTEKAVLDGRCDAALGAVVETGGMAGARPVRGVALTAPYYSAGYLLLRRPGAPSVATLAALRGTRIALEGESLGAITLRQQGHRVHVLRGYRAVIDAVARGRAEYGYLWGPLASSLTHGRRDVLVEPRFRPTERWNFALAVREADAALRRSLDRGIRQLVDGGALVEIFARYHVPYGAPAQARAGGGS